MDHQVSEAIAFIEKGDISKGLELLKTLTANEDDELLYQVSQTYARYGFIMEAKQLIDRLLQKYPNESELHIQAAEYLIDLNQEEEAIQHLNHIEDDNEHYLQALLLLAEVYQLQGLDEVAEQKLLYAHQLAPNEPVLIYALAEFYLSQGHAHKAIPFYEKLITTDNDIPKDKVYLHYAEALSLNGEFEDALPYFEKGLQSNNDLDSLFKYGYTALRAEKFEKAIKALEDLRAIDAHYSTLYPHLASAYEAIGALPEAMNTLETGLKLDEFNEELYYLAAKISFKLGKKDQAESLLVKAIELNPGFVKAYHLFLSYLKQENRYEEVVEQILRLKDADEDDPSFDWDLAEAYQSLEQYDLAREHYQHAYPFFKKDGQFLAQYGYFLLEDGKRKEALQLFKKAIQMDPQLEHLQELIWDLEEQEMI